jgi:hypothetical protein
MRHEREAHAMHEHGDKPFLCNYEGCERGVTGNGFPRHWNLRDHMRRVHNDPGRPKSDASGSPPRPWPHIAKKRKAGEQNNLYASKASSARVITPPRVIGQTSEPSSIDRYEEEQKLLCGAGRQLQDPTSSMPTTQIKKKGRPSKADAERKRLEAIQTEELLPRAFYMPKFAAPRRKWNVHAPSALFSEIAIADINRPGVSQQELFDYFTASTAAATANHNATPGMTNWSSDTSSFAVNPLPPQPRPTESATQVSMDIVQAEACSSAPSPERAP